MVLDKGMEAPDDVIRDRLGSQSERSCELTPQSTLMTVISVPSKELLSERVATFTHVHDEFVGALGSYSNGW